MGKQAKRCCLALVVKQFAYDSSCYAAIAGDETRKNPMMLGDDEETPVDVAMVNSLIVREYAVHCLVTMPVRDPYPPIRNCVLHTGTTADFANAAGTTARTMRYKAICYNYLSS